MCLKQRGAFFQIAIIIVKNVEAFLCGSSKYVFILSGDVSRPDGASTGSQDGIKIQA